METIHYEHLAGSPAEKLVARGMHEAFEAGHLLGFSISPEMEIIAGFDDNKQVIAFIVFDECVDYCELWLTFGYCVPEWRRKGPYRDCIKELRQIADERGYSRIHTAVQQDNVAARSSIEQRGGKLQYLSYTFPIKKENLGMNQKLIARYQEKAAARTAVKKEEEAARNAVRVKGAELMEKLIGEDEFSLELLESLAESYCQANFLDKMAAIIKVDPNDYVVEICRRTQKTEISLDFRYSFVEGMYDYTVKFCSAIQ